MYEFFNEDCLKGMKYIADESIDLTITSPPYDNLRSYDGYIGAFKFEPTAQELWRVTKPGGVIVWFVNDATIKGSETGTSFRQALYFKDIGFNLHDTMIYQKCGCSAPEVNRYYSSFEYMFVLSKGKPKTANLIDDRKNIYAGGLCSGSVRERNGITRKIKSRNTVKEYGVRWNIWKYANRTLAKTVHPATFPLQLAEDHIKTWSNEGDTVLDPLAGSGTTGVACVNLNRNFIGYEIHAGYYDIARKRIDEAIAKQKHSLF